MDEQKRILLVDDEEELLLSVAQALRASGLRAHIDAVTSAENALAALEDKQYEVVVTDLNIVPARGPQSGLDLLKIVVTRFPATRCVVLTGHGGNEFGIKAINAGAAHFIQKPPHIPHLLALIEDGILQAALRRERDELLARRVDDDDLVGQSAVMQELRRQIEFAASSTQPVLLCGETGVGKGVCARRIHQQSRRGSKRFVRYQPAFGANDLLQSELFGHVKGAFTGALTERRGLMREADGGTFFLDEIDALPKETQVLLLGALQDGRIRSVGADADSEVDFRLVAASNADLSTLVKEGKFRADLYHRIAHLVVVIPPLRSRRTDIPELVGSIVRRLASSERIQTIGFDESALQKLSAYEWPGNVRELEGVVEGAALRAQFEGKAIVTASEIQCGDYRESPEAVTFGEQVERYKLQLIQAAIAKSGGNQSEAARRLKIDRASMRRILARLG